MSHLPGQNTNGYMEMIYKVKSPCVWTHKSFSHRYYCQEMPDDHNIDSHSYYIISRQFLQ